MSEIATRHAYKYFGKPSTYSSASDLVFKRYQNSAFERGLDFLMSFECFVEMSQNPCFYCGSKPMNKSRTVNGKYFVYNGIDRKNNLIGYVMDNVVTCCAICNTAKSTMPIDCFEDWIRRVYWNFCIDKQFQ